jgi:hypothetical protein
MPYVEQKRRPSLDEGHLAIGPGELNYQITKLVLHYFREHGGKYLQINDVLGALEGAKLEFYRRVAAPYEDRKIAENGDVYP